MFKDLGIKGRVLLLTLLPTSLLAMVLGGYFTWVQLSDMRAQLIERGQLIAEQLAPLAATALARKDTAVLNRIANEALDQPDVRAVTFLDARQERLAHAGPSMLTVAPAGDASHLSMSTELDTTHFLLPVLGRHHSLSGATEPDDERVLGWVELELSHHGTLLRGYRSLFTSLLLIAAGLGVTALLALRMSRAINAPLELISQGVAQLKEGRMETRLPPMGSNELDELASGINRMAETLQSAQEEMQHNIDQATEDVRQNLETIEIQNIELDLARKEALEASRIKSEFLANMSHEIRTPLNGILGFTNLLQKSELSPRQQDYLTTIQKSAESLLGIINEILDFSKIEAGKLVLENLPFNLRDLIQDALTMLAPARPREATGTGQPGLPGYPDPIAGRPAAAEADPHQPGRQRHQVHPGRHRRRTRHARGRKRRPRAAADQRPGHRYRPLRGRPASLVQGLQPGRQLTVAASRWHRPGPGDLQAPD